MNWVFNNVAALTSYNQHILLDNQCHGVCGLHTISIYNISRNEDHLSWCPYQPFMHKCTDGVLLTNYTRVLSHVLGHHDIYFVLVLQEVT